MNVDKYSGAHNQNYKHQAYCDNDEQLEAGRYDEQCDEPDTNNVQTGKIKCTVHERQS